MDVIKAGGAGAAAMATGSITSSIIRSRAEIKEAQKNKLITPLGFDAVKNTNKDNTVTPAGYFRKTISGTVSGTTHTFNAGAGLVFKNAADNDDFLMSVSAGTNEGDIFQAPGFSGSSANVQSVTVTGLSNGQTIDVIATVYASNRSAKVKTTERMKILKLDKSVVAGVNGLTQENAVNDGYGYRVDDARISLGCSDVFKIKAIYESTNATATLNEMVPNLQFTNLVGTIAVDDVLTGDDSGSRARVV